MSHMLKQRRRTASVLNFLIPIAFAFLIGSLFTLALGQNPFAVYGYIIKKSLLSYGGIMNSLGFATPMIITGIATSFSFTAGVYNMGIEGQLTLGAFFAAYLGFTLTGLPPALHIAVCIAGGAVVAMLFSLIPALLKAYMRINEIVVTIMLNNIAMIVATFLTNGPCSGHLAYTSTPMVHESAVIPRIDSKYRVTIAFYIALVILIAVWIVLRKTRFGYEINCIGKQSEFSDAVGMKVYKKTIIVFVLGGLFAGIAGATEILGVNKSFIPGFSGSPGLGWDGLMICVLARQHPLGILVASVLFGAFKYGSVSLQASMGIPVDLINIIQSSLILFLSARYVKENTQLFEKLRGRLGRKQTREKSAL
ncbi:ABC transporter permease [Feifania hominis]|uniref:ABC transporter permease n=1 Tax=Feifania hominis TaxID=2763660 RepID=A0A926DF60_9FIRM|nr:ABC transporter permease [Feifania hominis]MBC8536727.1 ABC transporter permease [Feifania hominis]